MIMKIMEKILSWTVTYIIFIFVLIIYSGLAVCDVRNSFYEYSPTHRFSADYTYEICGGAISVLTGTVSVSKTGTFTWLWFARPEKNIIYVSDYDEVVGMKWVSDGRLVILINGDPGRAFAHKSYIMMGDDPIDIEYRATGPVPRD